MKVDLRFPILGESRIRSDHGYALYAALSRLMPWVHDDETLGVHPIAGTQIGGREIAVNRRSDIGIRLKVDSIPKAIELSGAMVTVGNASFRLSVPSVHQLIPSSTLRSRIVTVKGMLESKNFTEAARRQMVSLGCVSQSHQIHVLKRRTVAIHNKEIVGFEVIIDRLTAFESIAIQEQGVGGRRRMGCGVFTPFSPCMSLAITEDREGGTNG